LDTTQALLELVHFASTHQRLFLGQLFEGTVLALGFQIFQTLDGLTNGFPVGQHATQPAVVDIELVTTTGGIFYGFRRGTLGTYEQYLAFLGSYGADEVHSIVKHRNGFFQVDDVNLAAGTEDVGLHFRVPVTSLVTEVNAGLQHVAHRNFSHYIPLYWG